MNFLEFQNFFQDVYRQIDTSGLEEKYFDLRLQYQRFSGLIELLKNSTELEKGLDFGCGLCFAAVLAKSIGREVTGVDVTYEMVENLPTEIAAATRPFLDAQNYLKSKDFRIEQFDTSIYPWTQFKDNSVDFVITAYSVNKNIRRYYQENEPEAPETVARRSAELCRILKPGGTWFVHGGRTHESHAQTITSYSDGVLDSKGIKLVNF